MRQNLAEDINLHLKPIRTALSLQKLERIDPVSSSEPVISHNHMLRPNAYLSCQLSGDRNTEDSYDRRNGTGDRVTPKSKPCLGYRGALRSVPHTYQHKGPVHIEVDPKDKVD